MRYVTGLQQKTFRLLAAIVLLILLMILHFRPQPLRAAVGKMYWVNYNNGTVYEANSDGMGTASLFYTGTNPTGIVLDPAADKMYWTNYTDDTVSQANLDGSGTPITFPLPGGNEPFAIALDAAAGRLYWTNLFDDKVYRMNTDGSGTVEISLSCTIDTPKGIVLDLVDGKMYIASAGNGTIFRMNLDGTSCETIQTGLNDPTDIALDIAAQQIYWTSFNDDAIYTASLNGGAASTLISGYDGPAGLALDIPANKIYWVNYFDNTIFRADLDGTNPTDITPTGSVANGPHDIALHLPLPVVWDGGGVDNNWSTDENWSTDVEPTATDAVLFDATSTKDAVIDVNASVAEMTIAAAYTGQITMNESLTVTGNYLQGGGTFVVADPVSTYSFTVDGIIRHSGGTLQQTQAVGSNTTVPFLQIEDSSMGVIYRGATISTTTALSDLGNVTVSVEAVDQAGGEYCTTDGGTSPAYASRCFEITATNNSLPADITLYALTSELNGILTANLEVYRFVSPNWDLLAPLLTPGTIGNYSFASATTPGFSHFLLGGANAPTAVTLQSFSAQGQNLTMVILVIGTLLLLTVGALWRLRRQTRQPVTTPPSQ